MRRLAARAIPFAILVLLALPSIASAHNDGRGFYGETDDKVVTNAGFIVIAFFPILILTLTLIQKRLERRKDERKLAAKAQLKNAHLRGGW